MASTNCYFFRYTVHNLIWVCFVCVCVSVLRGLAVWKPPGRWEALRSGVIRPEHPASSSRERQTDSSGQCRVNKKDALCQESETSQSCQGSSNSPYSFLLSFQINMELSSKMTPVVYLLCNLIFLLRMTKNKITEEFSVCQASLKELHLFAGLREPGCIFCSLSSWHTNGISLKLPRHLVHQFLHACPCLRTMPHHPIMAERFEKTKNSNTLKSGNATICHQPELTSFRPKFWFTGKERIILTVHSRICINN